MTNEKSLTLNDKVLVAALKLSKGDIHNKFTAEGLLVDSWKEDPSAFGLRGYEKDYPDSNILYTKLMGTSGLVRMGYLKKVGEKTYTITEAGLSIASSLIPTSNETQVKVLRNLHEAITKIINHQVFREWLVDKNKPKNFRDAMWFWGIAPGTPPKIVKDRLTGIELNLEEAKKRAKDEGGKILLESRKFLDQLDIERCIEFNESLKNKFKNKLSIMLK